MGTDKDAQEKDILLSRIIFQSDLREIGLFCANMGWFSGEYDGWLKDAYSEFSDFPKKEQFSLISPRDYWGDGMGGDLSREYVATLDGVGFETSYARKHVRRAIYFNFNNDGFGSERAHTFRYVADITRDPFIWNDGKKRTPQKFLDDVEAIQQKEASFLSELKGIVDSLYDDLKKMPPPDFSFSPAVVSLSSRFDVMKAQLYFSQGLRKIDDKICEYVGI
jgi:hypothetical protein